MIVGMPIIGAPFPDIAMHVMEAESIGWKTAHRGGLIAILTFGGGSIGFHAMKVSMVRGEGFATVERGGGVGSASIFPFCFAG